MEEVVGQTNVVQLNVVRRRGVSGRIVVSWTATGAHQGIYDISPVSGKVSSPGWLATSSEQ